MLTMAQTADPNAFYGQLFQADKKPTKVLDALLRGIANYIIEFVGNKDEKCLTPTKLAAFYKSVGGNYDSLFVDVPSPSISWIYASIGCQHTLQPSSDDFTPPTIPALTPRGFVRWQSIEILLGPEEHVPFIQNAVRNFAIKNPDNGETFPIDLPTEAFPTAPDEEIEQWHAKCAEKLRQRATPSEEEEAPHLPPRPKVQGYSHVRASRPRVETDYFEPKSRGTTRPIPFQHVSSGDARPVRPRLSRSPTTRARQFLAPEDTEPSFSRSRRRSYPENISSPEIVSPPHATHPHADLYPEPAHPHVRRHSHSHHGHRYSISSDASSESGAETPSPTTRVEVEEEPLRRKRSSLHSHSDRDHSSHRHSHSDREPGPKIRFAGEPTPGSRPRSPDPRIRTRDRDRERDRDNEPKRRSFPIPIDLNGKLSAPFMMGKKNRDRGDSDSARGSRSNSHSRAANNVRWKDLYDIDPERRRTPRASDEDLPVQQPNMERRHSRDEREHSGGRKRRDKERERERERERDRGELRPKMRSRRSSHEDPGRRSGERERDRDRERERDRDPHERRGGSSFRDRDGEASRRGGSVRERDRDRRAASPPPVRIVDGSHGRRGMSPPIRGVDGRRYPTGHGS